MIIETILFVLGLVLLVYCSDRIVNSASALAGHLGISEFLVGVMVVSFGTSLPELVTSLIAASQGHTVIAVGNVIGSNVANIGLILAIAGMSGTLVLTNNKFHVTEATILVVLSLVVSIMLAVGGLHTFEAYALLGMFGVYLSVIGRRAMYQMEHHRNPTHMLPSGRAHPEAILHLAVVLFSALGLWLSASWIVNGVIMFSDFFGVGQGIVAMTAVAIGTSLPELSVALQAMRTHHSEILIGDILGANTINLLLVLGLSGLISPITVSVGLLWMLPVMVGFALLLWVFLKMGRRITAAESSLLLFSYVLTLVIVGFIA